MKHQALFSSKDKSKKHESVTCLNFAWLYYYMGHSGSSDNDLITLFDSMLGTNTMHVLKAQHFVSTMIQNTIKTLFLDELHQTLLCPKLYYAPVIPLG